MLFALVMLYKTQSYSFCAPTVRPVSSCLFTKLHYIEGALSCKHLKIYFTYDTFCKTKHISLKYDSDAIDLALYPLFLKPDCTASQFF